MSLPSSWRAGVAALLLAAPLALSGCSATTSGVPASLAAPVGNGSPIGGPTVDAGRDSLSTATTFIGTVMTSGGFTLYRNTKDKAEPPTSSCLGTCTSTWSPIGGDCAADPGRRRRHAHRHPRPPGRHQAADRRRVAGLPLHQGHAAGNRQRPGRRRRVAGGRARRQAPHRKGRARRGARAAQAGTREGGARQAARRAAPRWSRRRRRPPPPPRRRAQADGGADGGPGPPGTSSTD